VQDSHLERGRRGCVRQTTKPTPSRIIGVFLPRRRREFATHHCLPAGRLQTRRWNNEFLLLREEK